MFPQIGGVPEGSIPKFHPALVLLKPEPKPSLLEVSPSGQEASNEMPC